MTGVSAPGGKKRAWKPCRNKVEAGAGRCDECVTALLTHPNPQVRLELARDETTTTSVLEVLAGDMDIAVAGPANAALAQRLNAGE